jgi:hypothetical protein
MKNGLVFNEDCTHFWRVRANSWGVEIDRAEIENFIKQYAGTNITDFMLNCASRLVTYPSKINQTLMSKHIQKKENGKDVDYSDLSSIKAMYDTYNDGLDFYAICIEQLRKNNITPWMSIRMNDCHCTNQETSVLHSDFYHENPHLRRVTHRRPTGHFDRSYDFAKKEIYNMMLESIREVAFRYDSDGIELDWQREIFCFKIGHEYEGIEIINQFTRDVRDILDEAEKKWGHPIKLAARTLPTLQKALDCGFDVLTWVREGLIDMIIPTPRWETTDSDIPVELWKSVLQDYPVELAIGLEILQKTSKNIPLLLTSVESTNAQAAQYLSMGADKIYLYNYMDEEPPEGDFKNIYDDINHSHSPLKYKNYRAVLSTIGDKEKVVNLPRRHIVTYSDIGPDWFMDKIHLQSPLPITSEGPDHIRFTRVRVGEIPANAKIELILGASSKDDELSSEDIKVYINSIESPFVRNEKIVPYTNLKGCVFSVENNGYMPPFLVVEFSACKSPITVDYIEIFIS